MNRCTILVLYDKEGIFDEYVFFLIKELRSVSNRIVTVINGIVKDEYLKRLKMECDDVVIRENEGFDIGAYRHIILNYLSIEELAQYDELIFCNDTFFGPFVPLQNIFYEMKDRKCDFWGLGYLSYGVFAHIQSYFLVFRNSILQNDHFKEYFKSSLLKNISTVSEVCAYFEVGLFFYLTQRGYIFDSYIRALNYSVYENCELSLKKDQLPLIKKRVFERSYYNYKQITNALKFIGKEYEYNIQYILQNAKRKYSIQITMHELEQKDEGDGYIKPQITSKVNFDKIQSFLGRYEKFYIYGLGIYGKFFYSIIANDSRLKGFVVSNRRRSIKEYHGVKVYELDEIQDDDKAGIVVALNYRNSEQVIGSMGEVDNFFYMWEFENSDNPK